MKFLGETLVTVMTILLAVGFTNVLSIIASALAIAWWGYKFWNEFKNRKPW